MGKFLKNLLLYFHGFAMSIGDPIEPDVHAAPLDVSIELWFAINPSSMGYVGDLRRSNIDTISIVLIIFLIVKTVYEDI